MRAILIEPHKISLSLAIITLVLTALSVLERVIGLTSGLFNLGTDASLPTWYASIALLISAILLSFIAAHKKKKRDSYATHWICLSAIFFALSIDEVAMIHERAGDAFQETALQEKITDFLAFTPALEGLFNYVWVLIAVPLVSLFLLSYLRFVIRLPQQIRVLFVAAAGIFLCGSIGVETLAGYQHYLNGNENWTYEMLTNLEEFLEKIGIVVFIHALLKYITSYIGAIEIVIDTKKQASIPLPKHQKKSVLR